jgi:molybdenum cofactor cytidylyltransferase
MNDKPYHLKVIVLAAGKSERFKAIKLLADIQFADINLIGADNKTSPTVLIQHVLQNISVSLTTLGMDLNQINVATGNYHDALIDVIEPHYQTVYCADAHLGLGHTIAQSLEYVLNKDASQLITHVMITLADLVALTSEDYTQLIKKSQQVPKNIVCSKAESEIMPPAIFPLCYFSELMQLEGDKGAKALLYKHKENLQTVSLPNAIIDIDTKEDLTNWLNNQYVNSST